MHLTGAFLLAGHLALPLAAAAPGLPPTTVPPASRVCQSFAFGVPFERGAASLGPDAVSVLEHVEAQLRVHPSEWIALTPYGDPTVQDGADAGLAARRATSVIAYLAAAGFDPALIKVWPAPGPNLEASVGVWVEAETFDTCVERPMGDAPGSEAE